MLAQAAVNLRSARLQLVHADFVTIFIYTQYPYIKVRVQFIKKYSHQLNDRLRQRFNTTNVWHVLAGSQSEQLYAVTTREWLLSILDFGYWIGPRLHTDKLFFSSFRLVIQFCCFKKILFSWRTFCCISLCVEWEFVSNIRKTPNLGCHFQSIFSIWPFFVSQWCNVQDFFIFVKFWKSNN